MKNINTLGIRKKTCPRCGAENELDTSFCFQCGFAFNPKKKKKKLLIALIVVIVIIVGGLGVFSYQHQKKLKQIEYDIEQKRLAVIESYETKAAELYAAIKKSKSNFNIISTMFSTSTEMRDVLFDSEFYTEYTQKLCGSEISDEKSQKIVIDKLYLKLKAIDCTEEEILELKTISDKLYSAYCDRYDLLIEMNFNTNTFSTLEHDNDKVYENALKKTKEIIDELGIDVKKTNDKEK